MGNLQNGIKQAIKKAHEIQGEAMKSKTEVDLNKISIMSQQIVGHLTNAEENLDLALECLQE